MTQSNNCSRRRLISGCSILGASYLAGCLRLEDGSLGSDDSFGGENIIDLSPAWETTLGSFILADDGDFFTGRSAIIRTSPNGTTVFETDEFDENYRPALASGWRNGFYADEMGIFSGADSTEEQGARVYEIEGDTGQLRLLNEEPDDGLHDSIRALTRVDDLVVYASQSDGSGSDQETIVRALDIDSATEQWALDYPETFVNHLFEHNGRLVIQSLSSGIDIYDLDMEEVVENFDVRTGFERISHNDDVMYIPDTSLIAVDLTSSDEIWSVETDREINTRPCVGDQAVFYGTQSGYVVGHDLKNGDQLWETRVEGVVSQPPVFKDGIIWVGSERGGLTAFEGQSGDILYSEDLEPGFEFAIQDGYLLHSDGETAFEIQS